MLTINDKISTTHGSNNLKLRMNWLICETQLPTIIVRIYTTHNTNNLK